ncbi:mucosal pentraxin-like [Dermochelys coriacea]|uniref:mucosal pentraxin-like n=1 Tax=Dermochelys coriacea TaxID=27794 RepID=UPI0018E89078|nr:mucosal pentraxin-like [Dermochelys coriacea]
MEKLQLWLLVLAGLLGAVTQEDLYQKMFVFQKDPSDAHVVVKPEPEWPLQNFTVCLRYFTDLTRPYNLFSYAAKAQDNEILLFKPKPRQ